MQKHPQFCADIDADLVRLLSGKMQFFQQSELCLFVSSKNGQDLARCAAIINKKYQDQKDPGVGFIGFFAAAPDLHAEVKELFGVAEQWLRDKGVKRVIAPANGGAPQNLGFLVDGFDKQPMFPFPWHPPYYRDYIEQLDYNPAYPLWYYEIDFSSNKYREAKQKYTDSSAANIRTVSKKNWDQDLETLRYLLNETFRNEWEFTPLSEGEMKEFFGPMKPILDARQILIAEIDGKPVGFCLAMPDLTPLFRSFKGRVGLLEIFRLMTRAKKFDRAGILGIGVLDEFKGKGISKAMAMKLYSYHEELGFKKSLYYPVNEKNLESRGFAESIGGSGKVMYQVYDKVLAKA